MKKRFIAFLLCFAMVLPILPVYAVTEEAVCTCGTETDVHADTCALYVAPEPTCTCDAAEGEAHKEDCALYVAPAVCTCDAAEGEAHKEDCALYVAPVVCTCDAAEGETHKEGCALYVAPVTAEETETSSDPVADLFNRLMSAQTYEELDEMMENMTEEDYELLAQFSDEQNAALTAYANELSENAYNTLADVTVAQGGTATYRLNRVGNYNYRIQQNGVTVNNSGLTITGNGNPVTVRASESAATGTYTVQYRSGNFGMWSTAFTVEVTTGSSSGGDPGDSSTTGKTKVYVYVGTNDGNGGSWANNPEFLELLGISKDTVDTNNYFPVGEIYLDNSYLESKGNTAYQRGAALINSTDDWDTLFAALSGMNTQTLNNKFSANRGNKVPEYLSQVVRDIGAEIGSQKTALFYWGNYASEGFDDASVRYHLDLRFNTKKITFITGNNDITSGAAKDGTTVDSRVYITGSQIQEPRNLYIPDGYRFVGYYEDANFTIPWNGIGTPLNEDQTVYIKITLLQNVILNYVVAQGEGAVSPDSEGVNPVTGVPKGSTATAGEGYTFDGWYTDKDCTTKVDASWVADGKITPTKDSSTQWTDATYYAKFVPVEYDYTINYLNKDTNEVLINPVTLKAPYGSVVDTVPAEISNYTYDSVTDSDDAEDGTITIAVSGNVITYYYVQNKATITYKVVNPDGTIATDTTVGSVDLNDGETTGKLAVTSEMVGIVNGSAVGATATASSNAYNFVGWYSDEACANLVSKELNYVPLKTSTVWPETTTYYAKFEELEATITYVPRVFDVSGSLVTGNTTCTVSPISETIPVVTGTASGSTPASSTDDYKFDGWYIDEDCTTKVTDSWVVNNKITPVKNADEIWTYATYYAKFAPNKTTFTITKVAGSLYESDDRFVFDVVGSDGVSFSVTLEAGQTVTVKDVTVGTTYTVTERTDWSWRYTESAKSISKEIEADPNENKFVFTNTLPGTNYWLSGSGITSNPFK